MSLTRQQLYDRIRESSKDAYILEEMQRMGFWEKSDQPSLPETLIQQEARLRKELNELLDKQQRYNNREAMLKEMRAAKMKASKEKQAETKRRHEDKRLQKARDWQAKKENDISYLGKAVSGGLNQKNEDTQRLQALGLPLFEDLKAMAEAAGISLSRLRFLAYDRKVSKVSHYRRFHIAKKSGGTRLISAPMPKLKKMQAWILQEILYKIPLGEQVYGFAPGKNIQGNAANHLGKACVLNIDLKDFFPTLSYRRIKGLFRALGYAEQSATVLALLCTSAESETLSIDGEQFFMQKGERYLPQGSPASPALANLAAYRMDLRLKGLAKRYGFVYTRYADDLSFSSAEKNEQALGKLLHYVKKVIADEGFVPHPQKTKVMRKNTRQEVTGLTVNEKTNIPRETLRNFRALLHQIEQEGPAAKQALYPGKDLLQFLLGFTEFVRSVNPEKGARFKAQIDRILQKYPASEFPKPAPKSTISPKESSIETSKADTPKDTPQKSNDWWDIFE